MKKSIRAVITLLLVIIMAVPAVKVNADDTATASGFAIARNSTINMGDTVKVSFKITGNTKTIDKVVLTYNITDSATEEILIKNYTAAVDASGNVSLSITTESPYYTFRYFKISYTDGTSTLFWKASEITQPSVTATDYVQLGSDADKLTFEVNGEGAGNTAPTVNTSTLKVTSDSTSKTVSFGFTSADTLNRKKSVITIYYYDTLGSMAGTIEKAVTDIDNSVCYFKLNKGSDYSGAGTYKIYSITLNTVKGGSVTVYNSVLKSGTTAGTFSENLSAGDFTVTDSENNADTEVPIVDLSSITASDFVVKGGYGQVSMKITDASGISSVSGEFIAGNSDTMLSVIMSYDAATSTASCSVPVNYYGYWELASLLITDNAGNVARLLSDVSNYNNSQYKAQVNAGQYSKYNYNDLSGGNFKVGALDSGSGIRFYGDSLPTAATFSVTSVNAANYTMLDVSSMTDYCTCRITPSESSIGKITIYFPSTVRAVIRHYRESVDKIETFDAPSVNGYVSAEVSDFGVFKVLVSDTSVTPIDISETTTAAPTEAPAQATTAQQETTAASQSVETTANPGNVTPISGETSESLEPYTFPTSHGRDSRTDPETHVNPGNYDENASTDVHIDTTDDSDLRMKIWMIGGGSIIVVVIAGAILTLVKKHKH